MNISPSQRHSSNRLYVTIRKHSLFWRDYAPIKLKTAIRVSGNAEAALGSSDRGDAAVSTVQTTAVQVVVGPNDDYVRCGPAQFAIIGSTLDVRYHREGRQPSVAEYNLNSTGFNKAYRLQRPDGTLAEFLICREWANVHVRYGPLPEGKQYPVLSPRVEPREVRLVDDISAPGTKSSAFHPNRDIGLCARLTGDEVRLELYSGYLVGFQQTIKIEDLPSDWYTPIDKGESPLPVRLKRPFMAKLFGVRCVDVQWVG